MVVDFSSWGGEEAAAFFGGSVAGGVIGALVAIGILFLIMMIALVYVYFALAWYTIAKKMKHKNPWLAWIPFANISMLLPLGGFHWAWVFLLLIPFAGWVAVYVLFIIASWRIFAKRKYPNWF